MFLTDSFYSKQSFFSDSWRQNENAVCVEEVMKTFKKNVVKVKQLILAAVPNIAKLDWTENISELKQLVNNSIMLPNQYNPELKK